MAIIEANWNVTRKDLWVFGAVGAFVFALIGIGMLGGDGWLAGYAGKLMQWPVMIVLAVLCGISFALSGKKKPVPESARPHAIAGVVLFAVLAVLMATGVLKANGWGMLGLAALFLAGGFALPNFFRPVYFIFMAATFPLGMIMGPLILGVIFYGVFTPVALVFKAMGRDTMTRKFDPAAKSYWVEHKDAEPKRYFRQF